MKVCRGNSCDNENSDKPNFGCINDSFRVKIGESSNGELEECDNSKWSKKGGKGRSIFVDVSTFDQYNISDSGGAIKDTDKSYTETYDLYYSKKDSSTGNGKLFHKTCTLKRADGSFKLAGCKDVSESPFVTDMVDVSRYKVDAKDKQDVATFLPPTDFTLNRGFILNYKNDSDFTRVFSGNPLDLFCKQESNEKKLVIMEKL